MKKLIPILIAVLFIINNYSPSQPNQKDIIKEADLLLDMMEYESAIINYLKVLSQDPQQQDIRKNIGYAYYQLDKVDDALNYLKEELKLFPDNGDAYDFLVYVLYKLNEIPDANNFLARLDFPIRLTEENPHIGGLGCFILGMHFKEVDRFANARKFFRKALEKGHDPVECYVQLIDIDLVRGELDAAFQSGGLGKSFGIRIYEEAIGACGRQPKFFFLRGLRYAEKAKTNAFFLLFAIRYFREASKSKPNFTEAIFNLASISYNLKDFESAAEYFRRILGIEPENAEVGFYLNCCLEKLDKSAVSISEQCPETIDLSREFIDKPDIEYKYQFSNDVSFIIKSIESLALEFIGQGKFHEALKRFRNGLKIDPGHPGFYYNIGIVHTWLDNLEEAEKNYLFALRERDFFGTLPFYRKQKILGKEKKSIRKKALIPFSEWTFEVALEEGNYFIDAYNNLGTLYYKKKEIEKSILTFKKVIEIYPEDAIGHFNLGCCYKALKDKRNAEKEWKKAIKFEEKLKRRKERGEISENQLDVSLLVYKRPVSFSAHKELGWLYLEEQLPEKALKEFKKAIELEPADPEPYYELGRIYHTKSERNEKYIKNAIFYYEKYLYLGGEKEKEVKGLLKSLK